MLSINPTTKKQYPIPAVIDDKQNIDAFLGRHYGKKVVVVQGLGFVGAVMSIVVANADGADYAVIGIDLPTPASYWKICEINAGQFPIKSSDPNVEIYFEKAKKLGNFYATSDPYAYSKADVIIVDINLDVDKVNGDDNHLISYDVNLNGFKKAIQSIGRNCREDVHIIVETTVPPGTCRQIVYPIVCDELRLRTLSTEKLRIGHSYERVMPGPDYVDSIKNFYRVYAGIDEASADATEHFLKSIISTAKYPLTRLGNTNASEMAKVLENSYRAMNIAFMVEWSRFAEEAGVNIYEVVNAIRLRPTHANLMFPGAGVGGYCLTKDALMASWARKNMFNGGGPLEQSERGVAINDMMPFYAFSFIKKQFGASLKEKKVLLLGVSYRSDVADTRYSPPEYIYRFLKSEEAELTIQDPYVRFWEELNLLVPEDLDELLKNQYDLIVLSTSHSEYRKSENLYNYISSNPNLFVFDLVGIIPTSNINESVNKNIRVLGRGDI